MLCDDNATHHHILAPNGAVPRIRRLITAAGRAGRVERMRFVIVINCILHPPNIARMHNDDEQ